MWGFTKTSAESPFPGAVPDSNCCWIISTSLYCFLRRPCSRREILSQLGFDLLPWDCCNCILQMLRLLIGAHISEHVWNVNRSKLSVWFTTPADLSHAVKPQNDIYNCSLCLCPGDLCAYSLQIYHIFLRRHESVPQPVCPGLAWLWLWYLLDWPIKKPPPSFYFPLCFRSPKYWALNRICLNDLLRN